MIAAQKNVKGFTLVELLIVVSIVTVITGFLLPSFNTYIDNQNTKQAQEQVQDDLRNVQNRAINGEDSIDALSPNFWGIQFVSGQTQYTSFISVTADADACNNVSGRENRRVYSALPGGNQLYTSVCIFFSFANGDATIFPSTANIISVGPVSAASNECRQVQINTNGLIQALPDTSNGC